MVSGDRLLLVLKLQVLNINSLLHLNPLLHAGLDKFATGAELAHGTGLFEFPLELLEGFLDVLTFLDRNYNHMLITSFFLIAGTKVAFFSQPPNFFADCTAVLYS